MNKILVIDDDEGILSAFELVLTEAGYEVATLEKNGEFVKQQINKNRPNLIILDVLLSGSDGRHICKELKNSAATRQIPIIMVSAHPDAKKTSLDAGADEFLAKPFEIDHLLELVERYIKK